MNINYPDSIFISNIEQFLKEFELYFKFYGKVFILLKKTYLEILNNYHINNKITIYDVNRDNIYPYIWETPSKYPKDIDTTFRNLKHRARICSIFLYACGLNNNKITLAKDRLFYSHIDNEFDDITIEVFNNFKKVVTNEVKNIHLFLSDRDILSLSMKHISLNIKMKKFIFTRFKDPPEYTDSNESPGFPNILEKLVSGHLFTEKKGDT